MTNTDFRSTLRTLTNRAVARFRLTADQRLRLQVAHTPVAVLAPRWRGVRY